MDQFEGREPAFVAAEGEDGPVNYKEVGLVVVFEPHLESRQLFGDEVVQDGLQEREVLGKRRPHLFGHGLVGLGDAPQLRNSAHLTS